MNNVKNYINEQLEKTYFEFASKAIDTKTTIEQLIQKASDNGVSYNVEAEEYLEILNDVLKRTDTFVINHLIEKQEDK